MMKLPTPPDAPAPASRSAGTTSCQAGEPGLDQPRPLVVAPDQPQHAEPGRLPELVLAVLLGEDDVTGLLAGQQEAAVLELPVELPEQLLLGPAPVTGADQPPVTVVDLELDVWVRDAHAPEEPQPTGLTDTLDAGVGHSNGDVKVSDAGPGAHRLELTEQFVRSRGATVQQGVEEHQRRLRGDGRATLDDAARGRERPEALDLHDVVGGARAHVVDDVPLDPPGPTVEPCHMYAAEVDTPGLDAVRHHSRHVAQRNGFAEGVQNCSGANQVVTLGVIKAGPDVGERVVTPTEA